MRKALSVICDVVCAAAALLGITLVVLRLFGIQFLAVRTGSMAEAYPVGSLVAVRSCDPGEIEIGDVITYRLDDETDTYVTHRVVSIDAEQETFGTQGDANDTPDESDVSFSSLLGKVWLCIPWAGYPLLWLGAAGKWLLAGVLVLAAVPGLIMGSVDAEET